MKTKKMIQSLAVTTGMILASIVAVAQQPLTLQISAANPTCYGLNTGEIILDIQGGVLPYFVNGVEVNTNQIVEPNMAEGYYTYLVTDGNNASASTTVTLVAPPALGVQAIVSNVSSYGGTDGKVNVTVNNPSVTYFWYTEDGSGIVPGQEDQLTLSNGLYSLIITEANGCTTFRRYTVNQPNNPINFFNPSLIPVTQGSTGGNSTPSSAISVETTAPVNSTTGNN